MIKEAIGFGPTELIIILLIVLVLFGGRKLKSLGSDLGGAISEFKSSLEKKGEKEEEENKTPTDSAQSTTEKEPADSVAEESKHETVSK